MQKNQFCSGIQKKVNNWIILALQICWTCISLLIHTKYCYQKAFSRTQRRTDVWQSLSSLIHFTSTQNWNRFSSDIAQKVPTKSLTSFSIASNQQQALSLVWHSSPLIHLFLWTLSSNVCWMMLSPVATCALATEESLWFQNRFISEENWICTNASANHSIIHTSVCSIYHLPKYTPPKYFYHEKAKCGKVFLRHETLASRSDLYFRSSPFPPPQWNKHICHFWKASRKIMEVALMQHTADRCPANGFQGKYNPSTTSKRKMYTVKITLLIGKGKRSHDGRSHAGTF